MTARESGSTVTQEPFSETNREQIAHVARQIAEALRSAGKQLDGSARETARSEAKRILEELESGQGTGDVPQTYELARQAHQALLEALSASGKPATHLDRGEPSTRGIESYQELEHLAHATSSDEFFPEALRRRVEEALRVMLADAREAELRPSMKAMLLPRKFPELSHQERADQAARYSKMMSEALGKAVDLSQWMLENCQGSPSPTTGGRSSGTPNQGERQPHIPLLPNVPVWVDAPVISPRAAPRVPGRRFSANGQPAGRWVYPDSWYVIGPFPNRFRAMIEAKYPPEKVVDLDAVYLGNKGREVRWEFWKSESSSIRMPELDTYEIHYAWTEVYFDRASDCWLALGSDDNTKIWINDYLIYQSSNHLKAAQPDEAFRKVHFQEGYNRVLVRLENAIGNGAFFFMIYNE
ncbi:MAG: hypothetical protein ACFCUX_06165 [Candidatus Methylacidiphilales bacterium]